MIEYWMIEDRNVPKLVIPAQSVAMMFVTDGLSECFVLTVFTFLAEVSCYRTNMLQTSTLMVNFY
jgi:hypothetical protein